MVRKYFKCKMWTIYLLKGSPVKLHKTSTPSNSFKNLLFAVQSYFFYYDLKRNINKWPIDHIGHITSSYNNKQDIGKLSCFKRAFKDILKYCTVSSNLFLEKNIALSLNKIITFTQIFFSDKFGLVWSGSGCF